jgi:hypothetical protein
MFFSREKNQKTFALCAGPTISPGPDSAGPGQSAYTGVAAIRTSTFATLWRLSYPPLFWRRKKGG